MLVATIRGPAAQHQTFDGLNYLQEKNGDRARRVTASISWIPGGRSPCRLSYFGQDYPGPCGACDNDRRHAAATPAAKPFPVGSRVVSGRWGEGTVQRYDGDQVTVLFDDHGYRDLLVPLVIERRLLTAA